MAYSIQYSSDLCYRVSTMFSIRFSTFDSKGLPLGETGENRVLIEYPVPVHLGFKIGMKKHGQLLLKGHSGP